jgi:hypothetical protein
MSQGYEVESQGSSVRNFAAMASGDREHKIYANQDGSLNPGWQLLGEHELPLEASTAEALWEWVRSVLQPLDLPADFRQKILQSTLEAVMQVEAAPDRAPVRLYLFMPAAPTRRLQGWGFFRVETIEDGGEASSLTRHEIRVYLYREGN